ncbi:MAG: hypothetical protein SGI71_04700, partial [Verrucomicrobiota bacterium]|nr:hypothetical protein [Verrucomicrobiota bacterium]
HIKTFIIEDQDSNIRNGRDTRFVEQTRYRVQVRQRNHITDDIAATFDINKWSDRHVTEDFFQREFAKEVQPDNVVDVTKYDPNYTVSLVSRLQMNDFFETVERMPELALDLKRQKIAKTNLNYEGETSVARLRRAFSDLPSPTSNGILQTRANTFPSDFDATRLDSFHQLSYPVAAWKWLNIVPRAGIRGTYYSDSPDATSIPGLSGSNDDVFRGAANTGVEFSFKMHKTWTDYQNSKLDIDGLRHIMQPSLNYSFVRVTKDPTKIFPFDSQLPSTRLAPIEFPQFRSIDSIDDQNVIRLGVRNKLQTRRGVYATDKTKENWDLIDWNTYYEVNIEKNPRRREGRLSDLYNEVTLKPLRWLTFELDTRTDLGQFNLDEVNTRTTFQVAGNFDLWMDTRYLNDDEFFQSTATFGPGFRYRMNEDWAVGMNWRLEAETGEIEDQEYSLYRDFPSWATSLTFRRVLNRGGEDDNQVFLTFTLKGFPSVTGSAGGSPSSSGSK